MDIRLLPFRQKKKPNWTKKIELLKANPALKVICTGHACDIGSDQANISIGLRRAEEAKKYMVVQGIDADRISVVSKGDKEPLVPNTSEENRRQNRRIQILVVE